LPSSHVALLVPTAAAIKLRSTIARHIYQPVRAFYSAYQFCNPNTTICIILFPLSFNFSGLKTKVDHSCQDLFPAFYTAAVAKFITQPKLTPELAFRVCNAARIAV